MEYGKILEGGAQDLAGLLQKHSGSIAKAYEEAESGKGVDINLKLVITPGKENAVVVKSGISFTAERVTDGGKRTVTDQGELFEEPKEEETD
jgi:hypothetical protein